MDAINYMLSKRPNWDNIKNRPFYDNTYTTTITETFWCGGYLGAIQNDERTEISNSFWNTLLQKEITPICKYGTFIYESEDENIIYYRIPSSNYALNVSKTTNKAYVLSDAQDGTHIEDLELTCEITTGEIKKIDKKFLSDISASTMTVNITDNSDGTFSADKTFEEIMNAYNDGELINARLNGASAPMIALLDNLCLFYQQLILENIAFAIGISEDNQVFLDFLPLCFDVESNDPNKFLRGDGTWIELPLSFNDAGELVVTLNGVTKTFVPKSE